MRTIIKALALLLMASPAAAQIYLPPGVGLPPQSVIGNTLPQAGDAVAVSFAQLKAALSVPAVTNCPASQWVRSLAAGGIVTCSRPALTDISGVNANAATFMATPTSANLAAAVSDETGTGALVFANTPTLVTPNLGTPSVLTLTNATGLPLSTGISGLGSGVATALGVTANTTGGFATVPISVSVSNISGLGTGVGTALGVNVGTAGSFVVNGGALGSPSSVGTIPAFTLGGTVAGGGNQINNVIVGTSTPLAGTFTTLAGTTQTTSPLYYGGSAAGSTARLNGTSNGSPSSAFVTLQSNGQFVGVGNTAPKTYLDLNENLVTSPALSTSSSVMRMQAADAQPSGFEVVNYGGTGNILTGASAGGTAASPTATTSGQYLFNMRGNGYNAGWQTGGLWLIYATEPWSPGHQGTRQDWYVTPTGTATLTAAMALQASGGLSLGGSLTDPGAGAFLAAASIKSLSATAGVGYATGAGGAVTQITSRTTGVTLNTVAGAITLFSAAGSATPATFTVTNSAVAATDVVIVNQKSGTDKYETFVTAVAAGSFAITYFTTGGTTSEQPVFNFAVIKAVAN